MRLPVTDSPAQVSLSEAVEIAAAVRMVRTLRAELGTEHGTVQRVASQFSYGTESVRSWGASEFEEAFYATNRPTRCRNPIARACIRPRAIHCASAQGACGRIVPCLA